MFINLFQGLDMLICFNFKDLWSMSLHLWKLSFRVMVKINNSAQKANIVVFGGCEYSMSDILRGIAMSKAWASELDKPGCQSCYRWLLTLCLWAVNLTPYRSSSEGGAQTTVAIIVNLPSMRRSSCLYHPLSVNLSCNSRFSVPSSLNLATLWWTACGRMDADAVCHLCLLKA